MMPNAPDHVARPARLGRAGISSQNERHQPTYLPPGTGVMNLRQTHDTTCDKLVPLGTTAIAGRLVMLEAMPG